MSSNKMGSDRWQAPAPAGAVTGAVHPGSGTRRGRYTNKGRQLEADALQEVGALLGDRPRERDLLIEHLHLLQDTFGGLRKRHLAALADELRLPMAEVFEVATFYAHFDVIEDDAPPLPEVTVRVCDSLSCEMAGGCALLTALSGALGGRARVVRAPCMGRCDVAPVVEVGHNHVGDASIEEIERLIAAGATEPAIPGESGSANFIGFDAYRAAGGYGLLAACRSGERSFDEIAGTIGAAGLRGLGGAGFPAARKWGVVRAAPGPRFVCINADEGEPGTFKDRYYLERDPHRFLEGMLVAAWAVGAETCFIYLRDEYPGLRLRLIEEIATLERNGLIAPGAIVLRRGAGAYICGEESALIESIEGKRGLPRHRPPYVAEVGLFDRPTLVHNVETVFWIREIVEKGADWFTSHGRHGRTGLRSFSVSGRVRDPGVKLAPAGITVRELIDEYCGGMAEGHTFKAYLPGGASGGILPASLGDLPLDFDTLQEHGCFIGSAGIIVLSQHDEMRAVAGNLMRFFADESCGQCTPCRNGTAVAVALMQNEKWDAALLKELSAAMAEASICGLGQAAPNPILSVLAHFPDEVLGDERA
jgi:formate dehydrogenase beta subunit